MPAQTDALPAIFQAAAADPSFAGENLAARLHTGETEEGGPVYTLEFGYLVDGVLRSDEARYFFEYAFDAAAGSYRLRQRTVEKQDAVTVSGGVISFGSGASTSVGPSSVSVTMSIGGARVSFSTKKVHQHIEPQLEAAGWQKERGFFGKLFGRK